MYLFSANSFLHSSFKKILGSRVQTTRLPPLSAAVLCVTCIAISPTSKTETASFQNPNAQGQDGGGGVTQSRWGLSGGVQGDILPGRGHNPGVQGLRPEAHPGLPGQDVPDRPAGPVTTVSRGKDECPTGEETILLSLEQLCYN